MANLKVLIGNLRCHAIAFVLALFSSSPYWIAALSHWGQLAGGSDDFDGGATVQQIAIWWHQIGDYSSSWNPLMCGGAALAGAPEMSIFQPHIVGPLLAGPVSGVWISFGIFAFFGFYSMLFFARGSGLKESTALLIATLWPMSGFFYAHLGNSHTSFIAFFFLPSLLHFNRWLARQKSPASNLQTWVFGTFVFGLVGSFGPHFLFYGLIPAGFHFLFEIRSLKKWKHLLTYSGVALWGLLFSAVSILPALRWSSEYARTQKARFEWPFVFIESLFSPSYRLWIPKPWADHEYFLYIGPVLAFFAAKTLLKNRKALKNHKPLALGALAALLFSMGGVWKPHGGWVVTPLDWLKAFVPGFQALRVPSRFMIGAIPFLLLMGGIGLEHTKIQLKRSLLYALILIPVWVPATYYFFAHSFNKTVPFSLSRSDVQPSTDFRWTMSDHTFMMPVLGPNVGVLDCYVSHETAKAQDLDLSRGLILSAPPGTTIDRFSWSRLSIALPRPAGKSEIVRLNMNHHRDWRISAESDPAQIISQNRRALSIQLEPGSQKFTAEFFDPAYQMGSRISAFAAGLWLLCLCIWAIKRKRA